MAQGATNEAGQDVHSVRSRLRKRKKRAKTPDDLESEEDDGMERNIADYMGSSDDEDDFEADPQARAMRKLRDPNKKPIKSVKDLPAYAQNAYVASTYGLPKLPVPMVLLPGLRSRKPPPIPIPDLTKRSRGRHVASTGDDDIRKYHCTVFGCDKRFARGEHLKRHIRSIHTHEKPHQCPYPGCLRGFSRTDNMMQHMRTHDDWPDDEAAAQILAETQKKTAKKAASKGSSKKEPVQASSMIPPMPWQLPPFFWAQQRGSNPLVPILPVPPSVGRNKEDNPEILEDEEDADADAEPDLDAQDTASDTIMVTDDQPSEGMTGTESDTRETTGELSEQVTSMEPLSSANDPSSSKLRRSGRSTAKVASTSTADTTASVSQPAAVGFDPSVDPMAQMMQAGSVWPIHPGMQYPFMAMQGPFPPGLPFPPPAIAIPVPPGTTPPHPSQLPPNAQLIPDSKGGHTVIIPPPPPPWGLPFPGVLAMPHASPAEASGSKTSKTSD
ncbi:hypothetical protein FS842_009697 [Serendipita sp. 407]|nr:hypothetical protein FS842_009697 [Serendipita sp. 407]